MENTAAGHDAATERLKIRRQDIKRALDETREQLGVTTMKDLAQLLSVSRQYLYDCMNAGEVPWELAKKIETLTEQKIPRERLNPRVFG